MLNARISSNRGKYLSSAHSVSYACDCKLLIGLSILSKLNVSYHHVTYVPCMPLLFDVAHHNMWSPAATAGPGPPVTGPRPAPV